MECGVSCVKSQPISLRELWSRVNPAGFEKGIFVVMLWGHIDESGNGKRDLFSLTVFVAVGSTWFYIERDWLKALEKKIEN